MENDPTAHTDVDRESFDKLPLESASSSLSSLVTLATPGVAADSNGLFPRPWRSRGEFVFSRWPAHHRSAEQGFLEPDSSRFGPITGGNRGAPPAEYGGKTSLIINVTTQSGQGMTTPHGAVTASYGSFGTSNRRFQPRLRRPKVGELHLGERTQHWPVS